MLRMAADAMKRDSGPHFVESVHSSAPGGDSTEGRRWEEMDLSGTKPLHKNRYGLAMQHEPCSQTSPAPYIKDGASTAIQHAEPLAINVSEPKSRWVIRGAPRAIAESKRAMCKNICRQKAPCGNAQTRLWYQNEIVSKRTVYRLGKQGLRLRFPSVIHVLSLR
jgi:hypothetical protein